nr:hypothetical protein [uncultured Brevundimonas sp.]
MDLVERYLNAVAAQLPKDVREDIVAELRDEIMGRLEALHERLGRAPGDQEVEALLREVGHPLTVAARYRPGPQALIGPELYPWWWFAVKVALVVVVCVTVLGAVARVATGDIYVGQAIGQAINGFISGGLTLVGVLTVIGFFIERQEKKPKFISEWRVKDLAVFEIGNLDAETWGERLASGKARSEWFSRPKSSSGREVRRNAQMSPVAGAVASAIGWTVLLLWWTNLTPITPVRPQDLAGVISGVDYGAVLRAIVEIAYWPVIVFALARIAFDITRAVTGSPVRLTALGDLVFATATAWAMWWLFFHSPLSPLIWVPTLEAFWRRVASLFSSGDFEVATVIMIAVVWGYVAEAWRMLKSTARLIVGREN